MNTLQKVLLAITIIIIIFTILAHANFNYSFNFDTGEPKHREGRRVGQPK